MNGFGLPGGRTALRTGHFAMYRLELTDFGLQITFWKGLVAEDVRRAVTEVREHISRAEASFSVLIDWREVSYALEGAESPFAINENMFRAAKLYRMAGLINTDRTEFAGFDLKRINEEVAGKMRTFDEAETPNAEEEAIRWAKEGLPET